MLLAGTGEVTDTKAIENYDLAKNNNVKIGMFWVINSNNFDDAGKQVTNAKKFIEDEIKNKNRELKYDFYFKIKEQNNNKFNEIKEQILVIQKTLEEDASKRE